ncbi:MAG: type II-B CRISPR-associated RNA-guided endonuclease Cas9/Csx12 [Oxalobacter formigenes]|nr:type II-B CRISPR-associated RNA-guided endonuclease Cas9/Csx12 [Oxalobacter formigenes]
MTEALSILALDSGAKFTGIMSYTCDAGHPSSEHAHFSTLVLPTDGTDFTYSMTNRRMNRHRVRNKKRFNLARRLLIAVVQEKMRQKGITLAPKTQKKLIEALSGLLKRRGYSRIEAEIDLTPLEETDPAFFSDILAENGINRFNPFENIRNQWEEMAQDPSLVASLKNDCATLSVKEIFSPEKGNPESKILMTEAKSAFAALKKAAENIVMQEMMGHKHRADYFKAIRQEIRQDTRLVPAIQAFGEADSFWRIVCHISNLQLRAERWYFDGISRKGFYFDEKHLKKTLIRAYQYFHPAERNKKSFCNFIDMLKRSDDILETLATIDAEKIIPPYEDQNNRHPPVDQTLLLNPAALTKCYKHWQIWVNNLMKAEPKMAEGLDDILQKNDRKSAIPVKTAGGWKVPSSHSKDNIRASYILQRFLDRSTAIDPYAIRRLVTPKQSQASLEAKTRLEKTLGSQHMQAFLEMAATYYEEIRQARSGLWLPENAILLERSGLHPPMLGKVRKQLIGNVLGTQIPDEQTFIQEIWRKKISGRTTVASLCQRIEKRRKELGNAFNTAWQNMISRLEDGEVPANESASELKEKESLKHLKDQIDTAANQIAEILKLDKKQTARFNNPFSFAQLYNIIEEKQNGFTKTGYAIHAENTWRMQSRITDGQEGATCVRLTTDTVRPFDGFVRQTLDRTAWELAKMKAEEIMVSGLKPETLEITCLIEQNRFAYTASLADIKNMPAKKKNALEALAESNETRWMGKTERIKADSQGICPYTGKPLDEKGEIDHILPRSMTRDTNAAIFNSEVNLIYCSQEGNQKKRTAKYTLSDLNNTYLQKQFGTSDTAAIQEIIEKAVADIRQSEKRPKLDLLSNEQRRALRHALFIEGTSPAKERAMEWFGVRNSTLVNGTQAYLIQAFKIKLLNLLKDWAHEKNTTIRFSSLQISAEETSQLRQKLGTAHTGAQKTKPQSVASHAIDALCVYAVATADNQFRNKIGESDRLYSLEDISELEKRLPQECAVIRVARKPFNSKTNKASTPLFDAGMYAEHFIPLYWSRGKAYAGFHLKGRDEKEQNSNHVEITGKNPEALFEWLAPFAKKPVICHPDNHAVLTINKKKAFDWLASPESLQNEPLRELLSSLCYITVKTPVISGFLQDNGKYRSKTSREKKLTEKAFTIKLKYKAKDKPFNFEGNLVLPVYYEWKKIHELASLSGNLNDQIAGEALKDHFIGNRPKSRPHAGTRRIWSLPMIPSSSKGSMKIRRQSFDGNTLYQQQLINGAITEGFAADEKNRIEWNKNKTVKSAVYTEKAYIGQPHPHKVVPLDLWLTVYRDDNTLIKASPGSQGRFNICISQPFEDFTRMAKAVCKIVISSPFQILPELKPDKDNKKRFTEFWPENIPETVRTVFNPPRNTLKILSVGKTVKYSYTEESTGSPLRQLYQEAYLKQCDI